ncbi:hypothetical protein AMS68_003911 [Peltaster fructicola]|uniref:Uncharacterized protein n=1 Tax=Peltaster fructicola TaxID=286661 RepID=A0A6H0XUI3_9PEZI|nr:hypothetical protein AMS68_003911 [Peltaster fructicola]
MQGTSDPAQAQGAQLPLQSFNLPDFPPSARGLKALTLTSEIPVAQYSKLLTEPFSIPSTIPFGVESLTLELFSLGYPVGFLARLAERLPNLKSVVIYSQLFSGTTQQSQDDAVEFFKRLQNLRALHLLDVFARPGFFSSTSKWLKYNTSDVPGEARRGLMFLEINYTYDHEDPDLMSKVAATELHTLIAPGLISCSFNISPPEEVPGQISSSGKEGVMAFNESITAGIVDALLREDSYPRGLKALNVTLFTMTLADLKRVLEKHKNVVIVNATLQLEPDAAIKRDILAALEQSRKLEQFEVVGHPTLPFFIELASPGSKKFEESFPSLRDVGMLTGSLKSFKASILRSTSLGTIELMKSEQGWAKMS